MLFRPFSPTRRSIDRSVRPHRQRRDLALGRVEDDITLTGLIDPVDQPRPIRTGNQISRLIEGQRANMLFVALEKQLRLLPVARSRKPPPDHRPQCTGVPRVSKARSQTYFGFSVGRRRIEDDRRMSSSVRSATCGSSLYTLPDGSVAA